jgi:hypothetical protein
MAASAVLYRLMSPLPRSARHWGAPEAVASALSLALLLYLGLQRAGFRELLGLAALELRGDEAWLIPATVWCFSSDTAWRRSCCSWIWI